MLSCRACARWCATSARFNASAGAYGTVNLVVDRRTGFEYACKSLPKTRGRLTPAKTGPLPP